MQSAPMRSMQQQQGMGMPQAMHGQMGGSSSMGAQQGGPMGGWKDGGMGASNNAMMASNQMSGPSFGSQGFSQQGYQGNQMSGPNQNYGRITRNIT